MHTLLSRLNALFAFMCSALAAATALVFLQTLFVNYTADVNLDVKNIRLKSIHDYSSATGRSDIAAMTFSFSADLSSVFNWNVKELYVWLQADYDINDKKTSIIVWDKYCYRFGSNKLEEKDVRPLYSFQDDGTNLRGRNVTWSVHWTVVPNAGWMRNVVGHGHKQVDFPKAYNW